VFAESGAEALGIGIDSAAWTIWDNDLDVVCRVVLIVTYTPGQSCNGSTTDDTERLPSANSWHVSLIECKGFKLFGTMGFVEKVGSAPERGALSVDLSSKSNFSNKAGAYSTRSSAVGKNTSQGLTRWIPD
jgi:hypothetical protein